MRASLSPSRVCGQGDADDVAAFLARLGLERTVQWAYSLLDRLEGATTALAGGVVADEELDAAVLRSVDRDADLPGISPQRLVEQLADDRVERDLGVLADLLAGVHVEVDLNLVGE